MTATPTTSTAARRSIAALVFLATIAFALAVTLLGWGRMWGAPDSGIIAGTQPTPPLPAPWPPEGGRWPAQLSDADREYLLGLFQDTFAAKARGEGSPDLSAAPETCAARSVTLVVTTAFTRNGKSYRTIARKHTLAQSVAAAAVDTWARMQRPTAGTRELRLRIDVIQEALVMSPRRRQTFSRQYSAAPYGVAIAVRKLPVGSKRSPFAIRPAADAVRMMTGATGPHARLMEALSESVGRKPGDWRRADVHIWRIRADAFINDAPGSHKPQPCPHGLTPVDPMSPASQAAALRMAADHLLTGQDKYGTFPTLRAPQPGLIKRRCESLVEQADTTDALATSWASGMGVARLDALTAAFKGTAFLMRSEALQTLDEGSMKFAGRKEICNEVVELEATAAVLAALCGLHAAVTAPGVPARIAAEIKARNAAGRPAADFQKLALFLADGGDKALLADIEAMANFLTFMQRKDGLFDVRYIPDVALKITPPALRDDLTMQARAARALYLARRRLGKEHIFYVAAANEALRALAANTADAEDTITSTEARWIVTAVAAHHAAMDTPNPDLIAWVGRITRARRARQLTADNPADFTFVGGTVESFPPESDATAEDLVAFATACTLAPTLLEENINAAEQSAGYLMRLQYTPANSYYISGKRGGQGGFRRRPDKGVVPLGAASAALHGFTTLLMVEMNLEKFSD